jgi:hypothetical protein
MSALLESQPEAPALRLTSDGEFPRSTDLDRRRRVRIAVEQAVKLFDPVTGRYFAGHTVDVSDGGFCLALPARVPARAGQTAHVYVATSSERRGLIDHTMLVPVRYVWVRRTTIGGRLGGERCLCGVEVLAESAGVRRAA